MVITSLENLIFVSLAENLLIAKLSIELRKDPERWKSNGCYGFPAAILLLSIADTLGSYVCPSDQTRPHFEILNHSNYYNLKLTKDEIDEIYKNYRCLLTHNGALALGRMMDIGNINDPVIKKDSRGHITLNLRPLLKVSRESIIHFVETMNLDTSNPQYKKIVNIQLPV